jgi:hypothetical protein
MTAPTLSAASPYAARLQIDYPERLDRFKTFFRLIWVIPIAVVLEAITEIAGAGGGLLAGLAFATALMIVIRVRYPRWWFDFARDLTRFGARVGAYVALLTDCRRRLWRPPAWRSHA